MTSQPDMQGLDPKALEAAAARTRSLTFSALTADEHRDLVEAVARAYRSALVSLPQQTAEPVAWRWKPKDGLSWIVTTDQAAASYTMRGRPYDIEPLYTHPASPPVGGAVKLPWPNVHEYVESYEWRGDGDYTPTDEERALIEDAINGYIGEVEQRILSALTSSERSGIEAALIEECAKVAETALEGVPIEFGFHDGARWALRTIAAAIRNLAGTKTNE